jgi:SAM-dependent methyltransferase
MLSVPARVGAVLKWVGGPDVLDLGCSNTVFDPDAPNWFHAHIRRHFPEAWGLDIDEENVRIIRSLGYKNIILADAQSFDLNRTFDTVVAGEILEHVERPGDLLRSAAKHLKPHGRIVLTTPSPFSAASFAYALLKYPKTCSNPDHTMWFCPTTLQQLCERVGLRVVHWELVADYQLRAEGSLLYRIGAQLFRALGWVLPRRLRHNSMLFVLEIKSVYDNMSSDVALEV